MCVSIEDRKLEVRKAISNMSRAVSPESTQYKSSAQRVEDIVIYQEIQEDRKRVRKCKQKSKAFLKQLEKIIKGAESN